MAFDPDVATAAFDPCERLLQVAEENGVPLFEGFENEYTLPFEHYVEFGCTVPIDDGRNLSLTVTSVALADPAAARQEMEDLASAFGGEIVEDGLEGLPDGSYVTQGSNGETPKILVLLVPEPFAVAVVGGGTNSDRELATRIAVSIAEG